MCQLLISICTNETTNWLMHNWNIFGAWMNHKHPQTHKTYHDLSFGHMGFSQLHNSRKRRKFQVHHQKWRQLAIRSPRCRSLKKCNNTKPKGFNFKMRTHLLQLKIELGGSHHLPPYNIPYGSPWGLHPNVIFLRIPKSRVPKFPKLRLSSLWMPIISCENL
jgi:hypothetical protein